MSFEKYKQHLTKDFATLGKDHEERLTERQKVQRLLKGINTPDNELMASKAVVMQNYPRHFTEACANFSQQVSLLHGAAQLEDAGTGSAESLQSARAVVDVDVIFPRGGRGGRGGSRSATSNTGSTVINGVDLSNPTRNFTSQEWETLQANGPAYITPLGLRVSFLLIFLGESTGSSVRSSSRN